MAAFLPGICSDNDLALQLDPTVGPVRYGICVTQPIEDTLWYNIPGCILPTEYCPMGCCDESVLSPLDCQTGGGEWYYPATSESSCLGSQGCNQLDPNIATEQNHYIHRFSPKSSQNCDECTFTYGPFFAWTPAKYLTGNYQPLSQITTTYGSRFTWGTTLDFLGLQNLIVTASSTRVTLLSQSGFLCQYVLVLVP
jgi:hypothetical protein